MKSSFLRRFGFTTVAILTVALALASTTTAQSVASAPPSLQGTWRVQVTLYQCSEQQSPVPPPPFWSLVSFHQGGTETETTSNPGLQPGQRTAGEGFWRPTGANKYFSTSEAFILFDSSTVKKGVQKILQSIDLKDQNHFSSQATVKFFNADGTTVTGCAKAQAVRLTGSADKP